jgi:hypothetical protein
MFLGGPPVVIDIVDRRLQFATSATHEVGERLLDRGE